LDVLQSVVRVVLQSDVITSALYWNHNLKLKKTKKQTLVHYTIFCKNSGPDLRQLIYSSRQ